MEKKELSEEELDMVNGGTADQTRRLARVLKDNWALYPKANQRQVDAIDRIIKSTGDVDDDDAYIMKRFIVDNTDIKGMCLTNHWDNSGYDANGGLNDTALFFRVGRYGK